MISYTLIVDGYIVKRDGNASITFNDMATDLWEEYQLWLNEGNTPTPAQDDPFVLPEQSTPTVEETNP